MRFENDYPTFQISKKLPFSACCRGGQREDGRLMKSFFDQEVLDAFRDGAIQLPGYFVPSAIISLQTSDYILFDPPPKAKCLMNGKTPAAACYRPSGSLFKLPEIEEAKSYIYHSKPDPNVERRIRELLRRQGGSDPAGHFMANQVFFQRPPTPGKKVNFMGSLNIFFMTFNP